MRHFLTLFLTMGVIFLAGCGEREVVQSEKYYWENPYALKNKLMECNKNAVKKDSKAQSIHRSNCEVARSVGLVSCLTNTGHCKKLDFYMKLDKWTLGIL